MIRHLVVACCDLDGFCSEFESDGFPANAEAAGWVIDPQAEDVCPGCWAEIQGDNEREAAATASGGVGL